MTVDLGPDDGGSDCEEVWAESYARFAEYERTGEYVGAYAALEIFLQAVADGVRSNMKSIPKS